MDKKEIIKEVFGEYDGITRDRDELSAEVILDLLNPKINDESTSKKFISLLLTLELDVELAVRPINGLTAPFIVAVLENLLDDIKCRYPVESKFSHYAAAHLHHREEVDLNILTGSQFENYYVLDTIFKKGAKK